MKKDKDSAQAAHGRDQGPTLDETNPFDGMMQRFDRAAELLSLDPGIYRVEVAAVPPVVMDDVVVAPEASVVLELSDS